MEQFHYLLNAFERAAQADRPIDAGYAKKRKALIEHLTALNKDAERYRTARCMPPHQWSAAWELNVATGKPFDEIIDNMRPFVGGR